MKKKKSKLHEGQGTVRRDFNILNVHWDPSPGGIYLFLHIYYIQTAIINSSHDSTAVYIRRIYFSLLYNYSTVIDV